MSGKQSNCNKAHARATAMTISANMGNGRRESSEQTKAMTGDPHLSSNRCLCRK